MTSYPGYLSLYQTSELFHRIAELKKRLSACSLCPRRCAVDRTKGEVGVCRIGAGAKVSSVQAHFGEEPVLTGRGGSGTIFFTGCNMKCAFCQNHDISQSADGKAASARELASMMLKLQRAGCHNINLVTPTHQVPMIVEALPFAIEGGLEVPLVYNSSGYDDVMTLELLEGIIDIYMPDMKYGDDGSAMRYSGAPAYVEASCAALIEMQRQVGPLVIDKNGIAKKGVLVRHLVMPNGVSGSKEVFEFMASRVSKETYVNIMEQYRPCFNAPDFLPIARRTTPEEHREAMRLAKEAGLKRIEGH